MHLAPNMAEGELNLRIKYVNTGLNPLGIGDRNAGIN